MSVIEKIKIGQTSYDINDTSAVHNIVGIGQPNQSTQADKVSQTYIDKTTLQEYSCLSFAGDKNFTTVGNPKFYDQDVTNFSADNYLEIDNPFNTLTTGFEVITSFTRDEDTSSSYAYSCILEAGDSTNKNFRYCLYNNADRNVYYRFIDTNGTVVASIQGTTATVAGTKYWSKVAFDTTNGYKAYISTDGITWLEDGSDSTTTPISTTGGVLDIGNNYGHNNLNAFDGTLHLEDWSVKVDDNIVWTPFDYVKNWKQIPTVEPVEETTYQNNFYVVGTPTFTGSIVSNFSTSNYLQIPFPITSSMNSFENVASFKLAGASGNQQGIIAAYDSWKPGYRLMTNSSNQLSLRVGSDGSGYSVDITGTTTLVAGTKYWSKVSFDTTNGYKIYLSTDGETWNQEGSNSSTTRPYTNLEYPMCIVGFNAGAGVAFNGSIDLNDCYLKVNGETVWTPYRTDYYKNYWNYPATLTTSIRGVAVDKDGIAYGFRNNNGLVSYYYITGWNSTPYTVYVKAYSDNWKEKSYNILMFAYTTSPQAKFLYTNSSGKPNFYGLSGTGTTALTNSTWYWFKISYNSDGTKYTKLETIADNGYTLDTLPDSGWTQQINVSGNLWGNYYTMLSHNGSDYFNGKIDTKAWAVERNGEFVWKANTAFEPLNKQDVPVIHYGYTKPTTATKGKLGDKYVDKTNGVEYELTYISENGLYQWSKMMVNGSGTSVMIGTQSTDQYQTFTEGSVSLGTNTFINSSSVAIGHSSRAGYCGTAVGYNSSCSAGSYSISIGQSSQIRKSGAVSIGREVINGKASSLSMGGSDVLTTSGKSINKAYQMLDFTNGLIPGERLADSILKGTTAPTTSTIADYIGQMYIDTANAGVYICTNGALTENFAYANTEYRFEITRGIGSGFDAYVRYIHTNNIFTVGSGNYTLIGKVCRDFAQSGTNPIFGVYGVSQYVHYNADGKLCVKDSAGTKTGATTLTLLQWYWVKCTWDGTNFVSSIIADNGYTLDTLPTTGWTQQTTGTNNVFGGKALIIGKSNDSQYMRGLIDLRGCGCIENNVYAWMPYTISTNYKWEKQGGGMETSSHTVLASDWNNNSVTLTVQGVTADSNVTVAPGNTLANIKAYAASNVFCSSIGVNSVTLSCETTPISSLVVNIGVC